MKSVSLVDNHNGTWTARIFNSSYTGSHEACKAWLYANGEQA